MQLSLRVFPLGTTVTIPLSHNALAALSAALLSPAAVILAIDPTKSDLFGGKIEND